MSNNSSACWWHTTEPFTLTLVAYMRSLASYGNPPRQSTTTCTRSSPLLRFCPCLTQKDNLRQHILFPPPLSPYGSPRHLTTKPPFLSFLSLSCSPSQHTTDPHPSINPSLLYQPSVTSPLSPNTTHRTAPQAPTPTDVRRPK